MNCCTFMTKVEGSEGGTGKKGGKVEERKAKEKERRKGREVDWNSLLCSHRK